MVDTPEDKDKIKVNRELADMRVLIVDDNASDRYLVRIILGKLGIKNIQEADSGSTAIFKLQNAADALKNFDLVISDWNMPVKSGIDMLKFIRNDKKLKDVSVMMITSVAEAERVEESKKIGVEDFIVKPIQHKILADKIEKLLPRLKAHHVTGP